MYYDGVFYECDVARAAADTDDPETDVGSWSPKASSEGGITQAVQNAIDAQAAINFGDDYKGTWGPGVYAVGNVVYYAGTFYDCDVARAAADTDTPTVDAASWSVKTVNFEIGGDVNVDLSAVTAAIQNVIDSQGTASFGAAYQGTWAAGIYAVGDVVYQAGAFYTCDVARAATDTDDPATDAASWSIEVSESGGLDAAVQDAIDAQAAISFGDKYQGAWEPGVYAVGDIVFYDRKFYECTVARAAANTDDPSVDAASWSEKTSLDSQVGTVGTKIDSARTSIEGMVGDARMDISGIRADVQGDVSAAIQNAIDAQGTANFGDKYKGSWSAGVYAAGDVSYHAGAFYTCTVARAVGDTDNPATDMASWAIEVAESGGLDTAVQNAIDAQGAIQFGSDYKGAWEAGAFAVGDVVYHDGIFYECDVIRTAANTNNPAVNTPAWSVKTVDVADISGLSADVQNAINAQATSAFGDQYKGVWAAGAYAVGEVVYHSGAFYTCDVARAAADTDDPATDVASWTIKVAETGGLSQAVQDAIDAQATIGFGESYKGLWAAGVYAVGAVVFHSGAFFECIVARAAADTDNPSIDVAGWAVKESIEGGVTRAINSTVDALGAATFGTDYTGEWEAGVHAVGDVVSYNVRFYECDVARNAGNTNNPSINTGAWHLVGSAVTIRANLQDNIDALGYANYGSQYRGLWEAGVYDVDEYTSYSGRYYIALVARVAADTDDPSIDNIGWVPVGTSFTLQGDITQAKQENIDAAARIVFGNDYKGKWAVGVFAVGDVVYDEVPEKFYECDTARNAGHTNRPSVNTGAWSLLDALKQNVANSLGLARTRSQVFTSSGTWTRPSNVSQVTVVLIGGGGGGGGGRGPAGSGRHSGGGGGGGGISIS